MFNRILLILIAAMFYTAIPVLAQESSKYPIKTMTPQLEAALNSRKERFNQLYFLKSQGFVGENNRGYVEILKESPGVKEIVDPENHDRSVIYETIAKQNGLEGQLSVVESAFALIKRERANPGEMTQTEDGKWVKN